MRFLVTSLLLLPTAAFAEEVRITIGMPADKAVALIRKHSGRDITPRLAVLGPSRESLSEIYWEFADYDAILAIGKRDDKVSELSFWTKKDFGQSKAHRAQTAQSVTALKIDTKTKGVSIEAKKKDAG